MLVKHAYLALFLIFQVASSFYVFGQGLPQPADMLMAFLIVILATGFIVNPPLHKDMMFFGALFLGHVAVVNLFWYSQYQNNSFWRSPLYYMYDFGAMMVVLSLIRAFRERFEIACQISIAVAIVVELIALFLLPSSSIRSIGTFNNPNQLGYWALLLGCCWLVLKRDQRLTTADFLVLCGAGYMTAASLSKGAMLSFVLLLLMGVAFQRLTRPAKLLFLGLAFVGTSTVLLNTSAVHRFMSVGIVERVTDRLDSIGTQGDDSLGGRGYDRIWRHPEHLVFGAGEGAGWRFGGPINPHHYQREMHSTLGTVLFSYGIIGFTLFFLFLIAVFRHAPLAHVLYSLPIWTYGMTHQGLRDTMMWVVFGMVFGLSHYVRSASPLAVSRSHPVVERAPGLLAGPRASRLRPSRLNTAEAQAIDR
jgi:hypothetical protein